MTYLKWWHHRQDKRVPDWWRAKCSEQQRTIDRTQACSSSRASTLSRITRQVNSHSQKTSKPTWRLCKMSTGSWEARMEIKEMTTRRKTTSTHLTKGHGSGWTILRRERVAMNYFSRSIARLQFSYSSKALDPSSCLARPSATPFTQRCLRWHLSTRTMVHAT